MNIGRFSVVAAAVLLLLAFGSQVHAQISAGGTPPSFNQNVKAQVPSVVTGKVDVARLLAQDAAEAGKGVPMRFGYPFDVDYDLDNSGVWETLPNGDRLWRLRIECPEAFSINLIYDEFRLPDGARFYVYSEDRSQVIGAFTSTNNKPHGKFSTVPVKGDVSLLEYHEPADVDFNGVINIGRIVHAYRNMFNYSATKDALGFGGSGSCNNNVNCPESAGWEDQIRSVAMVVLAGGSRWCSGSLVNNVREDLTPYFLTANHCLGSEETWTVIFNYESPNCSNIDGPLWMSISGTTHLASSSTSDFGLLELSAQPPDTYNVYYNGWSAIDEASQASVAIHHPSGDIKKISWDYDSTLSTAYLGDVGSGDTHWRVVQWDDGTTEGGSSGSPLFDQNQRVVGQLHGGYASCASLTSDWYGKFSKSWANGGSASTRLKDWLDPDNTGTLVLDGRDATGLKITHDPLPNQQDTLNPYQVLAEITSTSPLVTEELLLNYQIASVWYLDTLEATGGADEFEAFIPAQSPGTNINYYLTALNDESEADTTDLYNFKVLSYGVVITPDTATDIGAVDDTIFYDFTVTNSGVFEDVYDLAVQFNTWQTDVMDYAGTTVINQTPSLVSNATFDFKVRVVVPTSLYGDVDYAEVTVTSTGDNNFSDNASIATTSDGEPLTIPFLDEFVTSSINSGYWVISTGTESNGDALNPPSSPYSANLDGDPNGGDSLMSQAINLAGESNVIVQYEYQRTGGGDSPESGDDLLVEYFSDLGTWELLQPHLGSGEDMTVFEEVVLTLPPDAYHSGFRLRFINNATDGAFDDWFVDDIYVGYPQDYDLEVTPDFQTQMGGAGESVSYLVNVMNKGAQPDNYDLSDSGATWPVTFYDASGTTIITQTGVIPANDSINVMVEVAIPGGSVTNEVDTADIFVVSTNDGGVNDMTTVVTVSAGAPGNFPWYDDFPADTLYSSLWLINTGAEVSSSAVLPPSPPYSLYLEGTIDTVVSQLIDLSGASDAVLSYYYEMGGNGDAPEVDENLWVEYKNEFGQWITVNEHAGGGNAMLSFENVTYRLPADAYHTGFQVRFHNFGSCADCDVWFVDDIAVEYAPGIDITPGQLAQNLMPGDSTTQDLIITSQGPGNLNYSLSVLQLNKSDKVFGDLLAMGEVEPARRHYPDGFHDYDDIKGVDDPREGLPVMKNAGGPDAHGYYWIDSDEAGGPVFDWVDISTTGTDIVGQLDDDEQAGPFSIGFAFPYYDTAYTEFYVGSNGIIGFDAAEMDSRFKASIPEAALPNNILALLWDDLDPTDPDNPNPHVYIDSDGSQCVISYVDYSEYSGSPGDMMTAQVILNADGSIIFQYLSLGAGFDVANCAVGIENADGTDGLEVAYLTSYLKDSLAIRFVAPYNWFAVDQVNGYLAPGEADTIMCSFGTTDLDDGTYEATITVTSNDPDPSENPWTIPVELVVAAEDPYICGDIDGDGAGPNITDLTYLVAYLFTSGPPPPTMEAANVDGEGTAPNIADLTYLVAYLFSGGSDPVCE